MRTPTVTALGGALIGAGLTLAGASLVQVVVSMLVVLLAGYAIARLLG